jgi:hypothetical protein
MLCINSATNQTVNHQESLLHFKPIIINTFTRYNLNMTPYFKRSEHNTYSAQLLYLFLGVWFLINLAQSALTGLHPDEAYYWIYSKFLDWGYFDHPPMVALYIKAGDTIIHSPLGLRLVTVITNTLSIFMLWQIVKSYVKNLPLFILLFSSVLIFHVYSFITTPDSPLYFFSILFLYTYQQYLKADKLLWAVAVGLLSAALLLSKYHGILVIFFILISNLKLFRRPSFWLAMALALLLFAPHIYWQYLNDFPSVKYHLFERSASPYKFEYTAQYFLDQLLMMGPLMGWFLIFSAWKQESTGDPFLRGLKFLVYGVFVFFFLNTFKGRVQAHWPLIEFIPLFMLSYIYIAKSGLNNTYKKLFALNVALILVARLLLVASPPALQKLKFIANYYGYDQWAKTIEKVANGSPVIFQDGFQQPSYYNYYNNSLRGFGYNSFTYRKTQFDIWPLEDSLQHKRVLYVLDRPHIDQRGQIKITTNKGEFYGKFIDQARLYQKIQFIPQHFEEAWKKAETASITFNIENPYNFNVDFAAHKEQGSLELFYGFYESGQVVKLEPVLQPYKQIIIPAKGKDQISIQIQAPEKAGKYKLFITAKTAPFPGSRNSGMINMNVK